MSLILLTIRNLVKSWSEVLVILNDTCLSEEDRVNVISCKLNRMSVRATAYQTEVSKSNVNYIWNK